MDCSVADGGGVLGDRLLLGLGVGFGLVGCGVGIGGSLLRLAQLGVLGGEIALQAIDLGLQLAAQGLNLFFHRGGRRGGGFLGRHMLFGRRRSSRWIARKKQQD